MNALALTPSSIRSDKRCGRSGIPDNRKCTKSTSTHPQFDPQTSGSTNGALRGVLVAAGLSTVAYIAARERYRGSVKASAKDALRRSSQVDTALKPRQKRIVFCVPGASGSESIQRGEGIQAAWQKSLSPEKNKKDEKTIMVDTRKANLDPRDSADANPQEIMAMHLKNQVRGRNEAAVDLASQIIAFRKAHPDKQIVVLGHSYGGAIAEEALAIVSQTKTKTQDIINVNFGTNNYGLLDGMSNTNITKVTLGSAKDPFTANGPTKNLRNITTVKGHSLRDYSSDRQVQSFVRNLVEGRGPLMRRDSKIQLAKTSRLDKKCGASGIPENAQCTKGGSYPSAAVIGAALTAGGIAAYALTRGSSGSSKPQAPQSGSPRLPGLTPKALISAGTPRKSKTQRMRENTRAAMQVAEGRIAQTAREEVRRVAQIGNTMAAAGEATGMAVKTGLREVRLRTEAARRRFEPGYRSTPPTAPKAPAQLPEGGSAFQAPVNPKRTRPPEYVEELGQLSTEELRQWISTDPRTGQPKRKKAQGFGRSTKDNYIPHYAPVTLGNLR